MSIVIPNRNPEAGTSILELMVVCGIIAIMAGTAAFNVKEMDRPLENSSAAVQSFFKQARAKAIATTSAYTVYPVSASRLATKVGTTCAQASPPADSTLTLDLPAKTRLTSVGWSTCFSSRGFASTDLSLAVRSDEDGAIRTVDVFLGGAVRQR